MPHDRNGKELTVGNEVNIVAVITAMTNDTLTVKLKHPIPPKNVDYGDPININIGQVVKAE